MSRKVEKAVSVDELARESLSEAECAQADRVQVRMEIVSPDLDLSFKISANKTLVKKLLLGLSGLGAVLGWVSTL